MSIPAANLTRPPRPAPFDVEKVRTDFPILDEQVNGHQLVYLDNGATTQKPRAVLDALNTYYAHENANVHRGVHSLSQRATDEYESARVKVQHFLHAQENREIIFVRGTTEGINLVAQTYGRKNVGADDEIIISHMEHHSNIVPWQMLCEEKNARLKVIPINDAGELRLDEFEKLMTPRTKLISIVHLSNSLGTINPVREMIELAHRRNIPVLLDGAQAVSHMKVDVRQLDCDFYVFSGHKLYGPTGIGVLYGKSALLEAMPPYQGGGDMIKSVTLEKTTYASLPNKFEAGTPHIAGATGLGAAIDYVNAIGLDAIAAHEDDLLRHATARLRAIRGVRIVGTAARKAGVLSFVVDDPPLSSLDIGTRLDLQGIAVRTGHHCCQPVMDRFNVPATTRASVAMYNTRAEIDRFADALAKIVADARGTADTAVAAPSANGAKVAFPESVAVNPKAAADEIADIFEFLTDWNDRYHHIIELGRKIPPVPAELKTEANRVRGCQSIVFLQARTKPGTTDVVEFIADSDADIVSGLIALLEKVFSGQKAADILAFDVEGFFARLGLNQHLTMGRRNGLAEMVKRIRRFAAALVRPDLVPES